METTKQTVPRSVVLAESRVSTILAKAEKERIIKKCATIVERMRSMTFVRKGVKNELIEQEEFLDRIS